MADIPDYSKKTFLIVDDMPFMLNLIHRMLRECGATHIIRAEDGASVLKMIGTVVGEVDYIIADCNMQPVNGLQLLQAVRSGANPNIPRDQPFVLLTGQRDADVVKSAMTLDVSGYLIKPVPLDKLVETLERISRTPITLKPAEYYQAIKPASMHGLEKSLQSEADEKQKISAWVVMSRANKQRNSAQIKSKIEAFKSEHTSRDGEGSVEIERMRRCDLADLADGMILAEDIHADENHILLKCGVRLTALIIAKLRELAVETQSRDYVWVGRLSRS